MSAAEQQATNAALATLAAAGNSHALGQLWETNRGLIRSMFWKWYPHHKYLLFEIKMIYSMPNHTTPCPAAPHLATP